MKFLKCRNIPNVSKQQFEPLYGHDIKMIIELLIQILIGNEESNKTEL